MPPSSLDLLRGTLDLLILQSLRLGPLHGYAVASAIRLRSDDELLVEEGALYPALHRLELRGLIAAEWGQSVNNRKARYYTITAAGKRELRTRAADWKRYVAAVGKVLAPGEA